jgi:hypothetical protein
VEDRLTILPFSGVFPSVSEDRGRCNGRVGQRSRLTPGLSLPTTNASKRRVPRLLRQRRVGPTLVHDARDVRVDREALFEPPCGQCEPVVATGQPCHHDPAERHVGPVYSQPKPSKQSGKSPGRLGVAFLEKR